MVSAQAQQVVDRLADSVAQQSQPSNGAAPVRGDSGSSSSGGASAPAAEPAVLLCGDFNAEPQSAELQVRTEASHIAQLLMLLQTPTQSGLMIPSRAL